MEKKENVVMKKQGVWIWAVVAVVVLALGVGLFVYFKSKPTDVAKLEKKRAVSRMPATAPTFRTELQRQDIDVQRFLNSQHELILNEVLKRRFPKDRVHNDSFQNFGEIAEKGRSNVAELSVRLDLSPILDGINQGANWVLGGVNKLLSFSWLSEDRESPQAERQRKLAELVEKTQKFLSDYELSMFSFLTQTGSGSVRLIAVQYVAMDENAVLDDLFRIATLQFGNVRFDSRREIAMFITGFAEWNLKVVETKGMNVIHGGLVRLRAQEPENMSALFTAFHGVDPKKVFEALWRKTELGVFEIVSSTGVLQTGANLKLLFKPAHFYPGDRMDWASNERPTCGQTGYQWVFLGGSQYCVETRAIKEYLVQVRGGLNQFRFEEADRNKVIDELIAPYFAKEEKNADLVPNPQSENFGKLIKGL